MRNEKEMKTEMRQSQREGQSGRQKEKVERQIWKEERTTETKK